MRSSASEPMKREPDESPLLPTRSELLEALAGEGSETLALAEAKTSAPSRKPMSEAG